MNKSTKIIMLVVAIIVIVAVVAVAAMTLQKTNNKENDNKDLKKEEVTSNKDTEVQASNLNVASAEDLEDLVNKIYEDVEDLPRLMTQTIDLSEDDTVKMFTGLDNGNDLEYLVVSEPLMSSQAYSLVVAKVKDGVNASKIAEKMSTNIDMRKWICVSAEKLYATNSGDVVFLVMSSEEWAKPVYDKFKELLGNVGEEFIQEETIDFPEDMY